MTQIYTTYMKSSNMVLKSMYSLKEALSQVPSTTWSSSVACNFSSMGWMPLASVAPHTQAFTYIIKFF